MPVYLKYGDKIKGEVKEPAHRGWIELGSAQFGVGRGVSTTTGGSAEREGSSTTSEIIATKKLDSASVHLMREALGGKPVFATIEFTRADGSVYLRIEMTGTLISNYSTSAGGDNPMESLTFNFTKVEFKNIPGTPPEFDVVPW